MWRIVIVAEDGCPTYAPETDITISSPPSTSCAGVTGMSTNAAPAGIVADETPGGTMTARPAPENATSNDSAGRPDGSASARETRKTPGVSVPPSACVTTATASGPTWKAVGQVAETGVPFDASALTDGWCVPAPSSERTAEYVAGSEVSAVAIG